MKTRKKKAVRCLLLVFLFLLIGACVWFFQFTNTGYLMSVPFRPGFREIADNVYVNRDYAGDTAEIVSMIEEAKARDAAFFGELKSLDNVVFIISDDAAVSGKIGEKDTTTIKAVKRSYICIAKDWLLLDILAHELTHAELHTRCTEDTLHKLPRWFDEGLATQNDYREQYSAEQWEKQTDNGKNAVLPEDMDTSKEFYGGSAEERRLRYICAKHEVASWIAEHSVAELLSMIEQINQGGDFHALYGK